MKSAQDPMEVCRRLIAYETCDLAKGAFELSQYVKQKSPLLLRVITNVASYLWRYRQYIRRKPISDSANARLFNERCDNAIGQLTLKSEFTPFTSGIPSVICVVRNEEYRIGAFIQHYLSLGVRSIHIIDNQSEDLTAEIAVRWPSVTLWSATGSFLAAEHGYLWSGALCRRYGIGKWILSLDADEFLSYSNMERKGLGDLQNWLTTKGQSSLAMPVVDMYPRRLVEERSCGKGVLQNFIHQAPYFDRPINKFASTCWIQKSNRGFELKGGVRLRMMQDIFVNQSPWVNVIPLIRWTEQTAYHSGSRHTVFPSQTNNEMFFAALLHFKFLGGFENKVAKAIEENQHWNNSIEYRRYAAWMAAGNKDLFDQEYSVQFQGYKSLIEAGLIQHINWAHLDSFPR